MPGFVSRSEAKRKLGDVAGADRDYWAAIRMEEQAKKGQLPSKKDSATDNDELTDEERNTREESDRNINKFNRLVVYDKEEQRKSKYQSEVRGRVQDRNVKVDLEPQFVLTYYEKPDPVKKLVYYDKSVEDFNRLMVLSHQLRLTNEEGALSEDQIARHFQSIDDYSARIDRDPSLVFALFGRAMDFMLVQDFAESIADLDRVIELNPDFALAYFCRAVERYKQLMYNQSQQTQEEDYDLTNGSMNLNIGKTARPNTVKPSDAKMAQLRDNRRAVEHEQIIRDYDRVIQLNPSFVFAYFNRANLRCAQRDFRAAIVDYDEAIRRDPDFAAAYFNRGLAKLSLGQATDGIADLSKSGELGIYNAYSIIKRMTARR